MRGQAVKERRQREAKERQAERDRRGDEAQLEKIINAGHGHCREADRLRDKIGGEIQETVTFGAMCGEVDCEGDCDD